MLYCVKPLVCQGHHCQFRRAEALRGLRVFHLTYYLVLLTKYARDQIYDLLHVKLRLFPWSWFLPPNNSIGKVSHILQKGCHLWQKKVYAGFPQYHLNEEGIKNILQYLHRWDIGGAFCFFNGPFRDTNCFHCESAFPNSHNPLMPRRKIPHYLPATRHIINGLWLRQVKVIP